MEVDSEMNVVLQDELNGYTYTLNWDKEIISLHGVRTECFYPLSVSSTHPEGISRCML